MPGTERIFSQHCRVTNGVTVKRSPMEITMSQLRPTESDGSSFIAKDTPRLLWNVSFSRLSSTGNSSDGCVRKIRYLLSEGAPVIRYRSWCALQLDLNALNTWREFSDQFSFGSERTEKESPCYPHYGEWCLSPIDGSGHGNGHPWTIRGMASEEIPGQGGIREDLHASRSLPHCHDME